MSPRKGNFSIFPMCLHPHYKRLILRWLFQASLVIFRNYNLPNHDSYSFHWLYGYRSMSVCVCVCVFGRGGGGGLGGFSVNNATLNKFFSLHYLFLFVLAGLILIHLILLHVSGSSSPIGLNAKTDKVPFHVYFITKDFYGFFMLGILLSLIVFYNPNLLGILKTLSTLTPWSLQYMLCRSDISCLLMQY